MPPISHVTAHAICEDIPQLREASVKLVSTIGQPLDQPQVAAIDVATSAEATPALLARIRAVVCAQLDDIEELTRQLINGEIPVYRGRTCGLPGR